MTLSAAASRSVASEKAEERRVIFASSLGTVFEWYDFYIYATLAPFFATLFFPPGNATAALLASFATYAAGFLVRPFGALVFGRIGDLVGRKYTFLVTISVMGLSTVARRPAAHLRGDRHGCRRPSWCCCAWRRVWRSAASTAAPPPTSPSTLRPTSAGCTPAGSRPRPRSGSSCHWSSSAAAGWGCPRPTFKAWGWRDALPHLARPARRLHLHPAEAERVAGVPRMKAEGKGSKAPLRESFASGRI